MAAAVVLLPATLVAVGCARQPETEPAVVRDVIERGPLRLLVAAWPKEVRVGDEVRVRVQVNTPEGYEVRLPEAGAFGDIEARPVATSPPLPAEQGLSWQCEFALLPAVSGKLEIPPLEVGYRQRSGDGASQPAEQVLSSGPLNIEVRSVLTSEDQPDKPRDITGTLLPPALPRPWWHYAILASCMVLGVAGGVGAYHLLRRWRSRPVPPILPEMWALRELTALEAPEWQDAARRREYYYRLTEILRCYIERKFGLAAPEMTTEEFLLAVSRDRQALPYDADRLAALLSECDLVKYAGLLPGASVAAAALRSARAFVDATAAQAGARADGPAVRSVGGRAA